MIVGICSHGFSVAWSCVLGQLLSLGEFSAIAMTNDGKLEKAQCSV